MARGVVLTLALLSGCSREQARPLTLPCPLDMQLVQLPGRGPVCADRFEVTADDYRACITAGACSIVSWPAAAQLRACSVERSDYGGHPADCLEAEQGVAYCSWAGKRLPTSEEWLLVATNGAGDGYPWGGSEVVSWWSNACSRRIEETCAVGTSPRDVTESGVFDMAGNVSEWARDEDGSYHQCGANAASVSVSAGISNACHRRWRAHEPGLHDGVRCFRDLLQP